MLSRFNKLLPSWSLILLLCFSLGLAPFIPEPHIWGKLKWVLGGAEGMEPMDWFDLLMHGAPWLLLIVKAVLGVWERSKD